MTLSTRAETVATGLEAELIRLRSAIDGVLANTTFQNLSSTQKNNIFIGAFRIANNRSTISSAQKTQLISAFASLSESDKTSAINNILGSLTSAQKTNARNNIGAVADVIRYATAQTLTDTQKAQARRNIGILFPPKEEINYQYPVTRTLGRTITTIPNRYGNETTSGVFEASTFWGVGARGIVVWMHHGEQIQINIFPATLELGDTLCFAWGDQTKIIHNTSSVGISQDVRFNIMHGNGTVQVDVGLRIDATFNAGRRLIIRRASTMENTGTPSTDRLLIHMNSRLNTIRIF